MNDCTHLRYLRLKYGITLDELADAAGPSRQHISRAELRQIPPTWSLEKKCEVALERIIDQRYAAARALEQDYRAHKGALLDYLEETQNGV
ncbi:MAG: helix-turn-helix domain-containing protein [Oscillospiraceae bacterium]